MISYWFGMVLLVLLLFGGTGVTQKLSTNRISALLSSIWFAVAFIPVALLIILTADLTWNYSPRLIGFAILGGALIGLGTLTIFIALERGGKASIVIPIVALYPLLTVLIAVIFIGERLSGMQWLGVGLAVIAGALLSYE